MPSYFNPELILKLLFLAVILAVPSFAQTQTVVEQVDVSGDFRQFTTSIENFYPPVISSGAVIGVSLDLNSEYYVSTTIFNTQNLTFNTCLRHDLRMIASVANAPTGGPSNSPHFNVLLVDFYSHLGRPLLPGESDTVREATFTALSDHWAWPGGVGDHITIGDTRGYTWYPFYNGYWIADTSSGPYSVDSISRDTFRVTGTLTWEWEPYLDSVVEVCAGDGHMQLDLVGEWGTRVRVVSNFVDQFSLLFRGAFYPNPGSSFCIGAGQRITESMRFGHQDFQLDLGTIIAGESFTLQAAHRYGNGDVRISNALQVTPQ